MVDGSRERVGCLAVGDRADARAEKIRQLGFEQRAGVGRVEIAVYLVEAFTRFRARRDHVAHYDPTLPSADPCHLGDRLLGVQEVVHRAPTHDQVERRVEERKLCRVAFLEEHVRDAGLAQSLGAELEERGREIDADDLADVRSDLFGDVAGAARDIEHDHLRLDRLQPRQRRVGTPGKR